MEATRLTLATGGQRIVQGDVATITALVKAAQTSQVGSLRTIRNIDGEEFTLDTRAIAVIESAKSKARRAVGFAAALETA